MWIIYFKKHSVEVGFLGIQVCYVGFESFMVTVQWSLRWSAMQKWNCYQTFWRHFQPASSRFDVMNVMSVCCTYTRTRCCQSLVSCLSTELCPCLIKIHWRPQVACHAACLMSGGWNPFEYYCSATDGHKICWLVHWLCWASQESYYVMWQL